MTALRRSARLQVREHKPSEESIRHRDIRNQITIASLVYNTISHTFVLLSSMLPNRVGGSVNCSLRLQSSNFFSNCSPIRKH
jgi:hypothetical protein